MYAKVISYSGSSTTSPYTLSLTYTAGSSVTELIGNGGFEIHGVATDAEDRDDFEIGQLTDEIGVGADHAARRNALDLLSDRRIDAGALNRMRRESLRQSGDEIRRQSPWQKYVWLHVHPTSQPAKAASGRPQTPTEMANNPPASGSAASASDVSRCVALVT